MLKSREVQSSLSPPTFFSSSGVSRWAKTCSLGSTPGKTCPGHFTCHLVASLLDPWTTSTDSFQCGRVEALLLVPPKRLNSLLSLSKGEGPSHLFEETRFRRFYPWHHSFSHHPELASVIECRDIAWPVNCHSCSALSSPQRTTTALIRHSHIPPAGAPCNMPPSDSKKAAYSELLFGNYR